MSTIAIRSDEAEERTMRVEDLPAAPGLATPGFIESVRRHGVIVPVTLVRNGRRLVIADGNRRVDAARKAGLEEIPVRILPQQGHAARNVVTLIGNEQRSENIAYQVRAFEQLRDSGMDEEEIAGQTCLSRHTVRARLRIADGLIPAFKTALYETVISGTVATELARMPEEDQRKALDLFLERQEEGESLKVREVRQLRRVARNDDLADSIPGEIFDGPDSTDAAEPVTVGDAAVATRADAIAATRRAAARMRALGDEGMGDTMEAVATWLQQRS